MPSSTFNPTAGFGRNPRVLWTRTDRGFVLNHLDSASFVELAGADAFFWSLASGVVTAERLQDLARSQAPAANPEVLRFLIAEGFLIANENKI